ncbi:thermonuclease family protein [Desulfurivibrio sp. C05AmB]|uniref:thermonuclease family protein n=1 Tax=Desulfurivibrio sp. C05AmB TaxID=3374371 RepID=UPI00376EBBE1
MISARPARVLALLLATWLALVASAQADTWQARVTNISDGDTITVITPAGQQERIRFYGIDAPESGQPFGRASTDHVKKVIGDAGFQVEIAEIDRDRYGRIVGMVIVNGLNLNRDLVRVGLAWVYPQYCKRPECREWRELEQEAKANKLGLWREPGAVPPWEWRRGQRDRQPNQPAASNQVKGGDCLIKGNINRQGDKIYHVPGGRYYEQTKIDESRGQRWFCSEEEAGAVGWRRSRE